jgi:hypothetical protein
MDHTHVAFIEGTTQREAACDDLSIPRHWLSSIFSANDRFRAAR